MLIRQVHFSFCKLAVYTNCTLLRYFSYWLLRAISTLSKLIVSYVLYFLCLLLKLGPYSFKIYLGLTDAKTWNKQHLETKYFILNSSFTFYLYTWSFFLFTSLIQLYFSTFYISLILSFFFSFLVGHFWNWHPYSVNSVLDLTRYSKIS